MAGDALHAGRSSDAADSLSSPQPALSENSGHPNEGSHGDADAVLDDHNAGFTTRRAPATSAQSFTPRSLLVGLFIGTLITFSNTYFGLQTGWISSMAMPSSLIGFAMFKALSKHLSFPFSPIENVLIQTVAGAVGTMPLGCGFVGVIPALEYLLREGEDGPSGDGGRGEGGPLNVGFWRLVVWSLGVCLFGVVFAVPLRKEVIVREKLKFPSGTATALMIRVLHGGAGDEKAKDRHEEVAHGEEGEGLLASDDESQSAQPLRRIGTTESKADRRKDWKSKIRMLVGAFTLSAFYTLFSYFVPQIRDIPILGLSLASQWLWTLNPSPAYVGQGIIMGPSTSLHMLFGAVLGWGFLSPLAKKKGWASGPVDDWENGSKGWIVWVSLAIMLADSIISLSWLLIKPILQHAPEWKTTLLSVRRDWKGTLRKLKSSTCATYSALNPMSGTSHAPSSRLQRLSDGEDEDDAPPSQLISTRTVLILLPSTLALNVLCMHIAFGNIISPFLSTIATLLALILSVMGVRALGETDLNPVSGISKLTQLLFSLVTPASQHTRRSAIVTNLLAGAVSESGALQAGDMMQDLKTGHLLGASPKAQFYGQLIGSLFGAVVSTAVYKMYVHVYDVPGPMFQTPTAYVWIFTARLVTGQGLPPMAWQAAMIMGAIFVVLTILRIFGAPSNVGKGRRAAPWRAWVPGGIAVAVGMYNVPSFTLARAIGGLIAWYWGWKNQRPGAIQLHQRLNRRDSSAAGGNIDSDHGEAESDAGEREDEGEQDESSSTVVVLASGLILGEGVISIVNLILASGGVPHL
ncbi:oligopeptide transporter, OPT family, putative [Paecilomyces variotii No. 5]|uniref:Oligopeptide transporter, OPT family, putative n=1 Tax=Byssochlamys spectabilis (strain No. 5 / NBRC 109023) TaxID=1356009 RepID=V5G5S5_BYSSN|nr:oligopeptide transporter, OPT family, putative [Paecilomyces variotii No. 5]